MFSRTLSAKRKTSCCTTPTCCRKDRWVTERTSDVDKRQVRGQIDVDHVSFAYQEGLAVLHDVDLHIRPGETLAVVGPSGGGKSTRCV